MTLNGKRVLITQFQLANYGGSEIVTLELAEYFLAQGAEVIVATNYIGPPIDKEFSKLKELKVFGIVDPRLEELLAEKAPDIAWIHHQIIPEILLNKINESQKTLYIFHHMSPFYHIEFPNAWRIERHLASAIVFNSWNTRTAIQENGLLEGYDESKYFELENPAPRQFLDVPAIPKREQVSRLLVVSNHIPAELEMAMQSLQSNGVDVYYLGREASKTNSYKRVMPDDLAGFDLVVTIGKTVQYAMLAGIPVYCYDHFGGPGYLTSQNFERARKYNFSGRGFGKKSSDAIADEILRKYNEAFEYAEILKKGKAKEFVINYRMGKLFAHIDAVNGQASGQSPDIIDNRDVIAHMNITKAMGGYISQQGVLRHERDTILRERDALAERVRYVERSKFWKIGSLYHKLKNKVLKP